MCKLRGDAGNCEAPSAGTDRKVINDYSYRANQDTHLTIMKMLILAN